jgi:hypothetical protein
MGFDPCNCSLKIRESIWDFNSQHGSSLGSVRVHSLTLFAFPGVCNVTFGSLNLATPCLGREPKAKVMTSIICNFCYIFLCGVTLITCYHGKLCLLTNMDIEKSKMCQKSSILSFWLKQRMFNNFIQ